jgi:hypothetical protein
MSTRRYPALAIWATAPQPYSRSPASKPRPPRGKLWSFPATPQPHGHLELESLGIDLYQLRLRRRRAAGGHRFGQCHDTNLPPLESHRTSPAPMSARNCRNVNGSLPDRSPAPAWIHSIFRPRSIRCCAPSPAPCSLRETLPVSEPEREDPESTILCPFFYLFREALSKSGSSEEVNGQ